LFDGFKAEYSRLTLFASFGLMQLWRTWCAGAAGLRPGATVGDFASGGGECWMPVARRIGPESRIMAIDISDAMIRLQQRRLRTHRGCRVDILQENALHTSLADQTLDHAVGAFGLKTFNEAQLHAFAREVARVLKPDGSFSFLEVSIPPSRLVAVSYVGYLRLVMPLIARAFGVVPESVRMLSVYLESFRDCERACAAFRAAGFDASVRRDYFGCVSWIVGSRRPTPQAPPA
jgi:demethylmenaquinone methyltransferase/2-methoxy-6-polyprenyl-1,4-benzoquinol methylase